MMQVRSELSTKLGIFVQCWSDAWEATRRPVLFLAIAPLLLVDAIWLLVLGTFPRPPFDALLVPAWRIAGGEFALHYPEALAALPRIVGWGIPLVTLVAGVPGLVLIVAVLPAVFHGDPIEWSRVRAARSRIPAAWMASLPTALVSSFALIAADAAAGPAASPVDALARDAFGLAFLGIGLVARALFAYAVAGVVLGHLGPGAALARSVSISSRYLGITLGFVVGASLRALPLRMTAPALRGLFEVAPPEIAYLVAAAGLLGAAFGSWFLMVTATRLYLHRHGVER